MVILVCFNIGTVLIYSTILSGVACVETHACVAFCRFHGSKEHAPSKPSPSDL